MIDSGAVYRVASDVRFRIVAGEAVVVRQEAGEVMALNSTGARILELVDGGRTVAAVVEALEQELEVSREQLTADVEVFLSELLAIGALERCQ